MLSDPLVERIAAQQAAARARAARLRALVPELARRLRERGATRVLLFGSLATGAEPHEGTDVDLCVRGLDDDARAEATLELEALTGADVDLVAEERASPRLLARTRREGIEAGMPPAEVARALRLRLASELSDDRAVLDRLAAAVESLRAPPGDTHGEWMRARALAFEIERYHTAVEATLARVLRSLDGAAPTGGPAWHMDLLRAAAAAVQAGRPALLSHETAAHLRELLKFRHLARHGYDDEPDLTRLSGHAGRIAAAHAGLGSSLDVLDGWLRAPAVGS